ncbi:flagellin A1 [Haloferax volcanii]|uniref:Flagellin A1 n=2 Tax=Haloferax volcanii TaxID=2246 RepID=FLGA1_HALVD|nr:flagellin A1 [Haloferax volcanii]D4GWY0.1 RecName: Full=Flagellin A1; Flags: Precursor [Haloferax volcanii DS2]ADE02581.1 archaellin A1 [Haloferax volcanii DS2]ELY28105.1 flagellin A1 [Haloferax volcanii DS2]MBS8117650.1 flagellin [Haloferax volcanii]MBS8122662.1 flagellin [Haloferax volcanii]MBS8126530.1 flagellin [Haloferax volcanii]
MFENINEDRGQVGIGTLIVFIAMVLVAAIAAGVLVNTAGFLQATAEDAGQQSVNKVTNRVDVVNAHGLVNKTGEERTVDQIFLTVRLAAGSGSVSLEDTTVKYLSETTARTLTYNDTVTGSDTADPANLTTGNNFTAGVLEDGDDSFEVLNEQSDRAEMVINTSTVEGDNTNGTATGQTVKLDITSRNGGTAQVILTMPQQLAGKDNNDPIAL